MICPTGIADYFASEDWTSQITLESFGKSPHTKNAHALNRSANGRRPAEIHGGSPAALCANAHGADRTHVKNPRGSLARLN